MKIFSFVMSLGTLLAFVGSTTAAARAQESRSDAPAKQAGRPSGPGESSPAPRDSAAMDREPYRIQVHLTVAPSARIDGAARSRLLQQWLSLVHRFVGPPWQLTIEEKPSALASGSLESLETDALTQTGDTFDKIWLIRVAANRQQAGLLFSGREYDTATRRLGPYVEHPVLTLADTPRALLHFAVELFNPTALITGQEGGKANLLVRGAAIEPASEFGRVVSPGQVFLPLRLVTMPDNSVAIRRILFTYLQVAEIHGSTASCQIVSALRDPLTQRVSRPNTLAALGVKPGNGTIRLRFLTRPDLLPAAGYTLTERPAPDGVPSEIGMTDRAGRIALKPDFAKGLVILRLVAANTEPMVEFPIMPGESSEERDVPFDPKPLTVSYQVKLETLRDEVIDLVALRSRIEKRMEARLQGDDLAGLQQCLKEYSALPGRQPFADRLTALKDQAAKQQDETKTAVLSKNVQAKFNELQALIDRYLDDEAFASFTEALERKRAEKEPVPAKKKSSATPAAKKAESNERQDAAKRSEAAPPAAPF